MTRATRPSGGRGAADGGAGGNFSGPPEGGDAFVYVDANGLKNSAITSNVLAAVSDIMDEIEESPDKRIVVYDSNKKKTVLNVLPPISIEFRARKNTLKNEYDDRELNLALSVILGDYSAEFGDFLLNKTAIILGLLPDSWVIFNDFYQYSIGKMIGVDTSEIIMSDKKVVEIRDRFKQSGNSKSGPISGAQVAKDIRDILQEGQERIDAILEKRAQESRQKGMTRFIR